MKKIILLEFADLSPPLTKQSVSNCYSATCETELLFLSYTFHAKHFCSLRLFCLIKL